jgi:hypothetical protein
MVKPKENMSVPQGQRELGKTDRHLRKIIDTIHEEVSSR